MTADMIALGKRAVVCRGWRWMAGMKIAGGIRVTESLVPFTFAVDVPDLSDPATMGCLLALVRAAYPPTQFMQDEWEMTGVPFPMHGGCDWEVRRACFDGDEKLQIDGTWGSGWPLSERVTGESEAEALVAALEAAP